MFTIYHIIYIYILYINYKYWSSSWTVEQSPPDFGLPQATTDPSAKIAANAKPVVSICSTFLSWSWTSEQSPPKSRWPQVTTSPSAKIAANASSVAWIYCTLISWSRTAEQSPPQSGSPQATTDPSAKIAANAKPVVSICCTFLSWSWTAEQSPPHIGWPQTTTDPSAKMAANAPYAAWICCTFLSWSWTAEQSPPRSGVPQVTTDPSAKIAANASCVAWICRTFLSWSLTKEQFPPDLILPQVTTQFPPQHQSAKASLVAVILARCATAVKCSPQDLSVHVLPQPRVSGSPVRKTFGPESSSLPLWRLQEVREFYQNHWAGIQLLEAFEKFKKRKFRSYIISAGVVHSAPSRAVEKLSAHDIAVNPKQASGYPSSYSHLLAPSLV